jgi:benzaldehyde dehydrogenase (NAD)
MALMDESAWRGKVFLGGWSPGGGGDIAVTEPATGAEIGRVGLASAADVARAAQVAAGGQVSWVTPPPPKR